MQIAILGAGAWGTALAVSFSASHDIRLWARGGEACERLASDRASPYLPGIVLPQRVAVEGDLAAAVRASEIVIVATPTAGLRETVAAVGAANPDPALLWACKGFEADTSRLAHEVVAEEIPRARRVGAISGPSFALEVARGLPAALTIASADAAFAPDMATALNGPRLRIYSSNDVVGVELGGALKNVIAIAAGIADGLDLGRNARAALVTRGLAEMVRMGVAMGGHPETFMGLTGLGDLVLTCTGDLSRNREVGLHLAKGAALAKILEELGHVAEGVQSARAALGYAKQYDIEMPITQAVCAVLFEGQAAHAAVHRLLSRDPRAE
jgi:glycerol-3-phosphate dehydrogenase (NAD(P)+)